MPNSHIRWYKDSQIISMNDSRITTQIYRYEFERLAASRLIIDLVMLSDEGVYRCEVEDSAGINSTETTLTVLGIICPTTYILAIKLVN